MERKRGLSSNRIQRSPIFNHPLGGGLSLQREADYQPSNRLPNSKYAAWAHDLTNKSRIPTGIEKFFHDKAVDGVYVSSSAEPKAFEAGLAADDGKYVIQAPYWWAESEIVSFNLSPARILMTTAIGGDPPSVNGVHSIASVALTKLPEPDYIADNSRASARVVRDMLLHQAPTEEFRMRSRTFWVSDSLLLFQ